MNAREKRKKKLIMAIAMLLVASVAMGAPRGNGKKKDSGGDGGDGGSEVPSTESCLSVSLGTEETAEGQAVVFSMHWSCKKEQLQGSMSLEEQDQTASLEGEEAKSDSVELNGESDASVSIQPDPEQSDILVCAEIDADAVSRKDSRAVYLQHCQLIRLDGAAGGGGDYSGEF
jgi:hypothetical protein